jgi:hypothetical protein
MEIVSTDVPLSDVTNMRLIIRTPSLLFYPALSSHVRSVGLNGEHSLLIYTVRGSTIVILKLLFCFASYI